MKSGTVCTAFKLYNENHAIVAWFKRALAMKIPPIVIE